MTIQSTIAKIGETQTFIAFNAHCWFAFAAVTVASAALSVWLAAIIAVLLATGKEFWFDLRYETTPPQTVLDSSRDVAGYALGIVLAVAWVLR